MESRKILQMVIERRGELEILRMGDISQRRKDSCDLLIKVLYQRQEKLEEEIMAHDEMKNPPLKKPIKNSKRWGWFKKMFK